MKNSIAFVILAAITSFSCKDAGISGEYSSASYEPGEVIVGFVDTVNYAFVRSFTSSLHLTYQPLTVDSSFDFWIQVDSGNVAQHIQNLEKYPGLRWALQKNYDNGEPSKSYIFAAFRDTVRIEDALALIRSINGLSWKETIRWPIFIIVSVPPGQEFQWIDRLKPYPFIRSAELDYIMHID